jgi:hypothetical protein
VHAVAGQNDLTHSATVPVVGRHHVVMHGRPPVLRASSSNPTKHQNLQETQLKLL